MIPTRRFFIFLAILVMLPFMAGRLLAAQNQDEGPGGQQGRGRGGPGRGPVSVDDRIKMMTKQFDLTSDQQAKLKPILENQEKKMQDLRSSGDTDRRDMREKMMAIQKDSNDQIRNLLDDKQKEKFDKMEAQREQRGRGPGGGQRGPGGQGGPDGDAPPPSPQN